MLWFELHCRRRIPLYTRLLCVMDFHYSGVIRFKMLTRWNSQCDRFVCIPECVCFLCISSNNISWYLWKGYNFPFPICSIRSLSIARVFFLPTNRVQLIVKLLRIHTILSKQSVMIVIASVYLPHLSLLSNRITWHANKKKRKKKLSALSRPACVNICPICPVENHSQW